MTISETSRLSIRELTRDDVPVLAPMLADPCVMRFSIGGVFGEEETRRFVQWCITLSVRDPEPGR